MHWAEHTDAAAGAVPPQQRPCAGAPEGLPRQDSPGGCGPARDGGPDAGQRAAPGSQGGFYAPRRERAAASRFLASRVRSAVPHARGVAPVPECRPIAALGACPALTAHAKRAEGPRLWTMTTVHEGEQDPASHHAVRSWVAAVLCVWRLLLCVPPLRFQGACATPVRDCMCTIGCSRTRKRVPWTIRRMGPRRKRVERGERWRQLKDPGRRKRMTS